MGKPSRYRLRDPARSSLGTALAAAAMTAAATTTLLGAVLQTAGEASPGNPTTAAYFSKQWGLAQIDAPSAWRYGTGAGVRIGIVDTGVDLNHPDLSGKVVAAATCINTGGNPSDCSTASGAGQDDNGHGTHVAGIAAASGVGVAGVAPGASLVVAKVLDSSGSGNTADVSAGINWVVAHGARVVNLSLGSDPGFLGVDCLLGSCSSSTITGAVEAAWQAGAIPVIAAGNDAGDLFGPGGYGSLDAVVVAATGPQGQFASDYSSTPGNAKWGVLAPGGDDPNGATTPTCGTFDASEILSTYWSGGPCYATDEGTSMATPFVSGTLALLLGLGLDQQQAVQTLLSTLHTSVNCGAGQGCQGLIDAGAAMAAAARTHGTSSTSTSAGTGSGSTSQVHVQSRASIASSGPPTSATPSSSTSSTPPGDGSADKPNAVGLSARSSRDRALGANSASARKGSGSGGTWFAFVVVLGLLIAAVTGFGLRRRRRLGRAVSEGATAPDTGGRYLELP